MVRLVSIVKKWFLFLLLLALGCSAQSSDPMLKQRVERHVRANFGIPAYVDVKVGERRPSEFPNYDSVTVTISQGEKKQEFEFLVSKDGKSLVRFAKLDITKDPYAQTMAKIDLQGRPVKGATTRPATPVARRPCTSTCCTCTDV